MFRRGLSLTLLLLVAVQLLGAVALASGCLEPCPDDAEESRHAEGCPPICGDCATCAHSRQAIVQTETAGIADDTAELLSKQHIAPPTSPLAADIFHVPLLG